MKDGKTIIKSESIYSFSKSLSVFPFEAISFFYAADFPSSRPLLKLRFYRHPEPELCLTFAAAAECGKI